MKKLRLLWCIIPFILLSIFFKLATVPQQIHGQTTPEGWYTVGANQQRTSWVPDEVPGSLDPELFTYIPSYIPQKVQPIIVNDTVYVSASDGLYAIGTNPSNVNPTTYEATSNIKWHYPTAMPLGHSPTVINGIAYVGGMDKKVHAVRDNGSSYTVLWTSPEAGAGFETNPVVANNLVYVANRDGKLYAYNITNGQLAWSFATGGPIQQSPAYKNNVLYIVSNDMYGYAVNATNGQQIWRSQAADSTTGKFPGDGFPTYWPVVTSQRSPTTGQMRDYVIFSRMEIWGNVNEEESTDIFGTPRNARVSGRLVGPTGTVAAGETWAPVGAETIDATKIGDYYARKPWRRVFFIMDAATGQEVKFDIDGDGDMEYAPLSHVGGDHGTHYPPMVGANGTLYQRTNYEEGNIPRGGLVGWKFGTNLIYQVGSSFAIDEPTGHSLGGNIAYIKLMGERSAHSANYASPNINMTSFYTQGGSTYLAQKMPELFEKGWPFAYWKHGSMSPMVPYKGKVYSIVNNAVAVFSTQGHTPGPNLDIGMFTGTPGNNVELSNVINGIFTNVTASNTAWPKLNQQETYFIGGSGGARAKFFTPFSIEGSASSSPTSIAEESPATGAHKLTSTFSGGTLSVSVTDRSPTILANNTASFYRLRGPFDGIAFRTASGIQTVRTGQTISGSNLTAGWILAWDTTDTHRWFPLVFSLEKRPTQITFSATGIDFTYPSAAGYLSIIPLNGMTDPLPGQGLPYTSDRSNTELTQWRQSIPSSVVTKAEQLARRAQSIPSSWTETTAIQSGNAVRTINYSQFTEFTNAWSQTPERLAYIPPQIVLADWGTSPIQVSGTVTDWNYSVPMGRIATVANTTTLTITLPNISQYWTTFQEDIPQVQPSDPVVQKLTNEVQKMVTAGHLRPGYIAHHQLGLQGRRQGEWLYEYFHNPGDTLYTLLKTLPYLDATTRAQVRSYIQTEYTNYNPATIVHVGYNPSETAGQANSRRREYGDAYPDFEGALPVGSPTTEIAWNPDSIGWDYTPSNIYSLYLYAKEFGNASSIFQSIRTKLADPFAYDAFKTSTPMILNNYITGHIGYLRLAQLAGVTDDTQVQAAERRLVDLLILRAGLSKYPESLKQTGFEYQDYNWTVKTYRPNVGDIIFDRVIAGTVWGQYDIYGHQSSRIYRRPFQLTSGSYAFTIDFLHIVPELGAYMNTYSAADVAKQVTTHEKAAPYWFVSKLEEAGGEQSIQPIHDTIALFNAKAYALNEPRQNLEKYIDVPAFARGDLYYIQKLTAVLAADGESSITPIPSPTPTAGDVNGDGNVTIADLSILLANFGGTGKTRGQGDVSGNDGNVTIADLSTLLSNFGG